MPDSVAVYAGRTGDSEIAQAAQIALQVDELAKNKSRARISTL
jgi:hypothetical protein